MYNNPYLGVDVLGVGGKILGSKREGKHKIISEQEVVHMFVWICVCLNIKNVRGVLPKNNKNVVIL